MRLIEIVLFLSPFAAFLVVRLLAPAGGLPAWVLPAFAASVVVMLVLLIVLRGLNSGDASQAYVPARLEDGRVIPGRAAPQ
jgi:Family of unknown function (DUF6111)